MPAVTDILNAVISTHVECDIGIFVVDGDGYIISAHVECDRMNDKKHNASNNFNSRTHVECDAYIYPKNCMTNISTHVECDCLQQSHRQRPNFNSRTHVECDQLKHVI